MARSSILAFASRLLAGAATSLVGTGCAPYVAKPLAPETTAALLDARTLTDAGLETYVKSAAAGTLVAWPPAEWDLDLLTLAAFYYHPALDVARAERDLARAAAITAGARNNPTLSVTPEYSTNPPEGISPWLPSLGLDLVIETAGKRRIRVEQAGELTHAAELKVLTTAWELRRDLRTALLDLQASSQRSELLGEQADVQQTIVRLLDQRRVVGAVAGGEVTLARAELARMRLDLQAARAEVVDSRARLAEALGLPLSALDGVRFKTAAETTDGSYLRTEQARQQALRGRADLLSALAEYEAAQSALQLEVAKQYPDVHLGPGFQWDQGERKWSLGVGLDLPFINKNEGPIAEAGARRNELAARFVALQAQVIADVDRAAAGFQVNNETALVADGLLAEQSSLLRNVEGEQRVGAADAMDVASARAEYLAAETLVVDAQLRTAQALGQLEDAVQYPLGSQAQVESLRQRIEATVEAPR